MQDKKVSVSVVTPAYNVEDYISQAIESILSQTFKAFEYIIIDDCSTDNTWKIIQEYAKKDKRIKPFKNEKNLGIAGNRNKCLSFTRGKYIAWQDADDISMQNRIEKQVHYMEQNPDVGICGSFVRFFSEKGDMGIRRYASNDELLRKRIFFYSPVAQPAAMIRKQCFKDFGLYDPRWPPAEDLDMSFRIGTKYKFANIQEVLVKYREHERSATYTKLKTIELNTVKIRRIYSSVTSYKFTFFSRIYNLLHYLSVFLVPAKLKIRIFDYFRNSN